MTPEQTTLFTVDEVSDGASERHEPEPFATIVVYFASLEDVRAFEALIGRRVPTSPDPDRLSSLWLDA